MLPDLEAVASNVVDQRRASRWIEVTSPGKVGGQTRTRGDLDGYEFVVSASG